MGRVQTNFTASDFGKGTATKKTAAKATAKKAEPESKSDSDSNEVPQGTTDEVMAWVDNDADKARQALATEKKNESPRVTLTAKLEKLTNDETTAKKEPAEKKASDGNGS